MTLPTATYRIQLNDHFRFHDLGSILEYLHELGISTVYASPVTTAFTGSQHGYDVADPLRLNSEIGSEEEWAALAARLRGYGMDWLQDIVPNHMVYAPQNPWLYDVLERGKVSPHYRYFDWRPDSAGFFGERIMAPFLGATSTECVQRGELTLEFGHAGLVFRYYDTDWPVAVHSYPWVFRVSGDPSERFRGMVEDLVIASLSPIGEWQAAKSAWLRKIESEAGLQDFIRRQVGFFNGRPSLLETLLGSQHYILTHHRLASSLINYRRFFTVNSLICLRMECPEVFDAYHRVILDWYRRGLIRGLRIDHIDGLAAPAAYLARLRERTGPDCFIVAEKILAREEQLPDYWDLQGTTGYEFLAAANQVMTDASGSGRLLDWYRREIIEIPDFSDLATAKKYSFLRTYMGGELNQLMDLLNSIPGGGAAGQDAGRLREAMAMLLACWPLYRLYPDGGPFTGADQVTIAAAFERAKRNLPECAEEIGWLHELFRLEQGRPFLLRFMQFTGPLAAKGIEDTSFYVFNAYIAHCEVGDTPEMAGIRPSVFHRLMLGRQLRWPHSLNATTTHDTKRGEDARIRLNLLSANAEEWIGAVRRWREMNQSLVSVDERGRRAPSANDEYLIYQALLGGWPGDGRVDAEFRERFAGYLQKALREAKTETNYDEPDKWYEGGCQAFATALLSEQSPFFPAFGIFALSIIRESYAFSLAQVLLKLTAPGIPDIYQGAECWETSFVDPDNRRPVDYAARVALLREIKTREAIGLPAVLDFVFDHPERGAMKMWVIYRALNFRRRWPELFATGEYIPVSAAGAAVVGYLRRAGSAWVLVLVPLIRAREQAREKFTLQLPAEVPGKWTDLFTGDVYHSPDGVLGWCGWERFPVAMLIAQ